MLISPVTGMLGSQSATRTAWDVQQKHFSNIASSDMHVGEIGQFCKLQDDGQCLMRAVMTQLNYSTRAYHRILKLARKILDLAGSEEIQSPPASKIALPVLGGHAV